MEDEISGEAHYYNSPEEDDVTRRLKPLVESWVDCSRFTDDEFVARVVQDEIDILVDLSGHTQGNRLLAFARKPAPIQATMLGYLNTTGMRAMDYRITDAVACPPEFEQLHTERIARLPFSQWCFSPDPGAPSCGPLPALSRGYVTFGSFVNAAKINQDVVALWAKALQAVENSRIMLPVWGKTAAANLLKSFECHGIGSDRVEIRDPLPYDQYLGLYHDIDISLDVFPYAGGTTSCESLWMGVPLITYASRTVPGLGGASILSAVGLNSFIAESLEEFVGIAARVSSDLAGLASLRASLRETMVASPLMDGAGYTRALEGIYAGFMLKLNSSSLSPESASIGEI